MSNDELVKAILIREFKRVFDQATQFDVRIMHDCEAIEVDVGTATYRMEVGSDDDYLLFQSVEEPADTVTIDFPKDWPA